MAKVTKKEMEAKIKASENYRASTDELKPGWFEKATKSIIPSKKYKLTGYEPVEKPFEEGKKKWW